ncbi:uncharacterized protein LOC100676061 isoform X2 [Loxodonta africana]|uniref:uncharacterized protein LOC100676061 isoform X2 n=1 Tax=Loxodonta africana TaxID=9785 RepID=UPI000C811FC7|nr:uncharacterized protein LOC100676061 isoform X2 [Loxodonta africana]
MLPVHRVEEDQEKETRRSAGNGNSDSDWLPGAGWRVAKSIIKSQPSARQPFPRHCSIHQQILDRKILSSLFQGPATKPVRGATMRQKAVSLVLCYLLLFTCLGVEAGKSSDDRSKDSGSGFWDALPYMVVGGGLMAAGLPVLGFTSAGIAANSMAAWMMSWSAVLNGGGVPAGGLVATLQSLGPRAAARMKDFLFVNLPAPTQ